MSAVSIVSAPGVQTARRSPSNRTPSDPESVVWASVTRETQDSRAA